MLKSTDDLRITEIKPLPTPIEVMRNHPRTDAATRTVITARHDFHNILVGQDDRLAVVVGPCSIHDPAAAMDYARRLAALREELSGDLEIIMRVYFEKPRTTVGWKGLINDPDLNGSFNITQGLDTARTLLLDIANLGLPAACEFLDMTTPQYLADLVAWAAIGARTTESQIHRELASGLSMPVGFKNRTDGDLQVAVDAIVSARHAHCFPSLTREGAPAVLATTGNPECHLVLRGGTRSGPNYDAQHVTQAVQLLRQADALPTVLVDCSHGNSGKKHDHQPAVAADVAAQIGSGSRAIFGVMLESNLVGGAQKHEPGRPLQYGQSITDACLGFDETVPVLENLAAAVATRRQKG